jgi:hypothetical protein
MSLFLNDGHGGLGPPVTYASGGEDFEIGDVTGDARDDVVLIDGISTTVVVRPQTPDGPLGTPATYTTPPFAFPEGIGVGDVTGDGRQDVVYTYGGNRPDAFVGVLAQTSDGRLAASTAYPTNDIPEPVDVADFDLDGRNDVAVLHGGFLEAGVHLQQPNGTLGLEELYGIPYSSHYPPDALAVGDVNGDGSPDIVAAGNGSDPYPNGLVVLRNVTSPASVPGMPGLVSAAAATSSVSLGWRPPASNGAGAAGYEIYRGTAAGAETLLAKIGTATSYTDGTAASGVKYFYKVRAFNNLGEGPLSGELSATPDGIPPSKPAGLKLVAAGTNQLGLDWSASTDNVGVSGYDVLRGGMVVATVTGTEYLDSGLGAGTNYTYQVRARDRAGNVSPLTGNLSAKTTPVSKASTGVLSGVFYDATGKPLEHVVVKLTLANGTVRSNQTNGSGVWKIDNLPPGGYTLTGTPTGHPPSTFTMTAVAGTTALAVTTLG